jgi:mRNA interferase HigB
MPAEALAAVSAFCLTLALNVVSKRGLMQEAKKHREATPALENLHRTARKAESRGPHQVRNEFLSADGVGSVRIFNVLGGSYRLITTVNYRRQTLFVKALLTHKEYDRKEWMRWPDDHRL